MPINILIRCKGPRTCSACGERVYGSLSLPSGEYICDREAIPVLEALIIAKGPIGIVDEDAPEAIARTAEEHETQRRFGGRV